MDGWASRANRYLLQFPLLVFPECKMQKLIVSGHFQINILEKRNKHMRARNVCMQKMGAGSHIPFLQTILANCLLQSWHSQNLSASTG